MEKEELCTIKSCFEKLHTFLLMRGDISSEVRTEQAGVKTFGSSRDTKVKEITFFDGKLC